ncbi:MAG: acylphosphatase [Deltaproteobacteria bacterium]|nr:acylphosphatase [Deltaproteobacteria bacterium]
MESGEEKARAYLKIEGRVQGVFFRASTVEQANHFGLTGWVRNCRDGSVEVVAEGGRKALEALARWCRKGPPGAEVADVQLQWEQPRGEFADFRVRR